MKKHILIEKAKVYPTPKDARIPVGYIFDEKNGYWRNVFTAEALMLSSDPRRPQTKKEDNETGEDQKGE